MRRTKMRPECDHQRRGCICHTIFARGFAITSVATHLTLNHGFPIIRLCQLRGCIDSTESLAERQRRSPPVAKSYVVPPPPLLIAIFRPYLEPARFAHLNFSVEITFYLAQFELIINFIMNDQFRKRNS